MALDGRGHSQGPQTEVRVKTRPEAKNQKTENAMTTRAAIYARISTVNNGQSVGMQLRDLRQLAQQRGFEIVGEFCDEGVSGSKDSRPQLDRMLAEAQRGKFQAILIWRLDRLGRSLQHLVKLFEYFQSWNVALISYGEGLDFSTSMGKLFYQLSGAFAEFEKDTIRERVKAGLRNAKAKGTRLGRPRKAVDAATIAALRSQGRSIREIAYELGYSRGVVHKSLADRGQIRVANTAD
jgi:DNA invertase Pin-like site-specific DNA recombinase